MVLLVLLAFMCLASVSPSATSITLKQERYAMVFVRRKWNSNNTFYGFSCYRVRCPLGPNCKNVNGLESVLKAIL